jgi:23S rRNA (pseudouridine1915-N3)-methyltransferase
MKIRLIAVGKQMPSWVQVGYQEYARRCALDLIEIPTGRRTKNADIQRLIQREGEQMLAAIPPKDIVVVLDERGQLWNTQQLAQKLQQWQESAVGISLLIGGPDGLAPACFARAQQKWSLSPLTLPHLLVRIIVAEQIYRALSILQHHPYHRS